VSLNSHRNGSIIVLHGSMEIRSRYTSLLFIEKPVEVVEKTRAESLNKFGILSVNQMVSLQINRKSKNLVVIWRSEGIGCQRRTSDSTLFSR